MPPTAKEMMSKAQQPMSISQLCQQEDSDDELHNIKQELDRDRLDLNENDHSGEDSDYGSYHGGHGGRHQSDVYNQQVSDFDDDENQDYRHFHRNKSQSQSNRHNGESEEQDMAEQLAAEALGDMAADRSASFSTPAVPFISRMSSLPLVNSALKVYASSKQSNQVLKYGAGLVESGVKSLSKPVFDKLEPKLGQLDDFACRQLDKVYPNKTDAQPFPSPAESARSSNDITRSDSVSDNNYFAHRSRGDSIDSLSSVTSSRPSFDVLRSRNMNRQHEDSTMRQRSDSQSSQRGAPFQFTASQSNYSHQQHQQQQISSASSQQQFSGWRGVVATVGSASAAGVAIFSEESMKSLKYCLQWLQYAVQHIDHQIGLLRAFLVSLASPSQNTAIVPSTAASTLASIKKEVVETLRKVINIVSRYAGACLPDHAKISVRQFILSMPVRWATLNNESVPSTPIGSPSLGPVDRSPDDIAALQDTSERATRVLVLANESSDMLRSVASIFKDSVDKAENWMDKLRYVGMNPQNNSEGLPSWAPTGFPTNPGGTMPGGFPGASLEHYSLRQSNSTNGHHATGHATPTGSPTRSLKSSPRLSSRNHKNYNSSNRHAYRQTSVMSGDEDSASDEEDRRGPMMDDDSSYDDEEDAFTRSTSTSSSNGHGPMKRSMGSLTHAQGSDVRRRKKRGESAEAVAGLGLSTANGHSVKEEPM
ncbi:hypothetical protein BGZ83_005849 [Gryganskiella cystojenkinii]|nr:hypothetical protein BGZ83_005849 [Gryganskiella cystojenkinii]